MAQIAEHLLNDVIRNALNHPLFFCQGNKFRRAHNLTVESRPAQQRLCPHALVIFNINDGLIMDAQLAFIQRPVQKSARRIEFTVCTRPHQQNNNAANYP
ncbi:Uncharacterised protein [Enterobacter cloacae]|nr:Uncharacterised protein [Enterobacter cloacae]